MRFFISLALVVILAIAAVAAFGTFWTLFLSLALGIAIREVWQSGNDLWVQGRSSITGDYDTLTTGSSARSQKPKIINGKIARTLHLDQRGRRVTGVENEEDTKWSLDGKLNGEFVFGTWQQTAPPSSVSMGSFHLRRDPTNPVHFLGRWVGWDPVQGVLGGGEWEWTRRPH